MDFSIRKKRGDEGVARKKREDKTVQIRKDRRLDRANLQRRRYQEEEEEEESKKHKSVRHATRRNLDALPQKATNLYSDNTEEMIEAASYFRKVLATDKFPPVDLVVEAGVVPRLVQMLARHDLPKLQLEAAWAITNIACAEVRHARLLIDNGALPLLVELIANSRDDAVREQSLWALGNISADVNDCRDLLLDAGILSPLLWQLGIDSPPHRKNVSPSLFTMRHVTWTCSNLIRGYPPPPTETFRAIIYAFSELLHSPDEELLNDACAALVTICEVGADNIALVMEQGLLSRLRELCEISSVRESAVLVLCSIMRSSDWLQFKVLLSRRFSGALRFAVSELPTACSDKTRIEILQSLRCLFDVDSKYVGKCLALGLLDVLCATMSRNVYEVNTQAGYCLCCMVKDCSPEDAQVVLAQGLPYFLDLLTSTEPELLILVLSSLIRCSEWVYFTPIGKLPKIDELRKNLYDNDVVGRIGLLASHPVYEISSLSVTLENLLEKINDQNDL